MILNEIQQQQLTANSKNENEIRDRERIQRKKNRWFFEKIWSYFIHFGSQKKK